MQARQLPPLALANEANNCGGQCGQYLQSPARVAAGGCPLAMIDGIGATESGRSCSQLCKLKDYGHQQARSGPDGHYLRWRKASRANWNYEITHL